MPNFKQAQQCDTAQLEAAIGYKFKNAQLLTAALTHSSRANEGRKGEQSYERLEFLGDSVLSLIVSEYIYKHHTALPEGELTKMRAGLVNEAALFGYSKQINLQQYLLLGRGEEANGGRVRASISADVFEAVIAAIYLDGGLEKARAFVQKFLETPHAPQLEDYKTQLQEVIQQNPEERLRYVVIDESGPDHDKHFAVEVLINSNVIGRGEGKSKKQAEQAAAEQALQLMGLTS